MPLVTPWTRFLDALGAEYHQPTGELVRERVLYAPAFFVLLRAGHPMRARHPQAGYWLDVLPEQPGAFDRELMQRLSTLQRHKGFLVYGSPGQHAPISFPRLEKRGLKTTMLAILSRNVNTRFDDPAFALRWSALVTECAPQAPNLDTRFERAMRAAFDGLA